jgi:hypothetical protein
MHTLKHDVVKAINEFGCLGSWWTFEDKIPQSAKEEIMSKHDTTEAEILRVAQDYSQEMYSDCKPRPRSSSSADLYRFAKDWG